MVDMSKISKYWNDHFSGQGEEIQVAVLSEALRTSWDRATAYPSDAANWTEDNPSLGQCAVTSLIVNNLFGGRIHRNSKFRHYWNELPSGRIVDLTREQFKTDEEIRSEGSVSRNNLLEGERAAEARTRERYELLGGRLESSLSSLRPTIFLLSSNARAEYIQDVIEAVGLPNGSAHHFRYSVGYLDPLLKSAVPLQGNKMPSFLDGVNIVVTYLNQTRRGSGNYLWNAIVPVRLGVLKNCFRTSESDNATAHFFFQLEEGLLPCDPFQDLFKEILGKSYQKKYAVLTFANLKGMLIKDEPTKVFEDQCKNLLAAGFTYIDMEKKKKDRKKKYGFPLMVLLEGLYKKGSADSPERVRPQYDDCTNKSYYYLTEAKQYHIKYRTMCWDIGEPRQLRISFPKESFSTPSEYTQNIRALYYSETIDIELAYLEHGTRGFFKLETITLSDKDSPSNQLDCQISIPFQSKRRLLLRILDSFGDFLFAIGPTYLAATKIFESKNRTAWYVKDWAWVLIAIYGIWFIIKLTRNAIRGK